MIQPHSQKWAFLRRTRILHLKIADLATYENWIAASQNRYGGQRLFRVKVDPVSREGMLIDEIVLDEFPSAHAAFEFMADGV